MRSDSKLEVVWNTSWARHLPKIPNIDEEKKAKESEWGPSSPDRPQSSIESDSPKAVAVRNDLKTLNKTRVGWLIDWLILLIAKRKCKSTKQYTVYFLLVVGLGHPWKLVTSLYVGFISYVGDLWATWRDFTYIIYTHYITHVPRSLSNYSSMDDDARIGKFPLPLPWRSPFWKSKQINKLGYEPPWINKLIKALFVCHFSQLR